MNSTAVSCNKTKRVIFTVTQVFNKILARIKETLQDATLLVVLFGGFSKYNTDCNKCDFFWCLNLLLLEISWCLSLSSANSKATSWNIL